MPLVGSRSYLGNAELRTAGAAGEEVGFNLTGRAQPSPLTFGLAETCGLSPGEEQGAAGASPTPRHCGGPGGPGPAPLQPGRSSLPRRRPRAGISQAEKKEKQADAKPPKYPALICKLAQRHPAGQRGRRSHRGRGGVLRGCCARQPPCAWGSCALQLPPAPPAAPQIFSVPNIPCPKYSCPGALHGTGCWGGG